MVNLFHEHEIDLFTLIGSLFDIGSFHYIYFNLDNNKLIIPCCKSYYCFCHIVLKAQKDTKSHSIG